MAMPLKKSGEFTYKDYMSWPESERWQLLDGVAYAMAPPSSFHQRMVAEISRQFGNQLLGKKCQVLPGPVGLRLPKDQESDDFIRTVFEPDLAVVCDAKKIDRAGIRGAPDLVIEVLSPSTAAFDQINKRDIYANAGVKELWLVDPESGVFTIYRQASEGVFAAPEFRAPEGVLDVVAVAGLHIDLELVRAILPDTSVL
jgi:Uma2 family endonuclease